MQNKKLTILIIFLLSLLGKFLQAQPADAVLAYIARYKDLAISEMQRTGIPAAITLAQGIHETEAGMSDLVKKSNNHFGIKCKDNWNGPTVSHDDDARGECFRKYDAPEQSYRDHSDFLKTRSNYSSLFKLDPTEDYTLIALGKMNPQSLAKNDKPIGGNVIEAKNVDDKKADIVPAVSIEPSYPSGEFKINDTRVIYVRKGTSYLDIAQRYEIALAKLFEFNDLKPLEVTRTDQLVFIQRKRKTGDHEFHVVQAGEDLTTIAQIEAIRLESLLEYNNLASGMQPAVGETLSLRSKTSLMPRLFSKNPLAQK
jgi:hypothetical protein